MLSLPAGHLPFLPAGKRGDGGFIAAARK